jgi:BMFP domain-containing protein YqiC
MRKPNNLVTKPFLRQELNRVNRELKRGLGKLRKELRGDFIEKFDEVMGELKGIREDFDIYSGNYGAIREQVEDHEERIVRLEGR